MDERWILTERDFKNARVQHEREKIDPLTEENMFRGGLYCILSSAENYQKLIMMYERILEEGIDTPQSIRDDRDRLGKIIRNARFPNIKEERIYKFALWWSRSSLPWRIFYDIKGDRKNEFYLRNQLAREAPGMGYKCSSLFLRMCGYENVVPVDIWVLRYLDSKGHEVEIPDFKTVSGITKKEYLRYERLVSDLAKEDRVSPSDFQLAVWVKNSSSLRKRNAIESQLKLMI